MEHDLIKSVEVELDEENRIKLYPILESLQNRGFLFSDTIISFFNPKEDLFESVGRFPVPIDYAIDPDLLVKN